MKEFQPTYLCIKQHSITGLLYLCKTTKSYTKMLSYKGSGKPYWNDHLKIHGKEFVETPWFELFTEKDELVKFALLCSEIMDIVKTKDENGKKIWANLKPEDGLSGGHLTDEIIKKAKQTKLEKYGNENFNNMEKHQKTNLEKYGVYYSQQSNVVREKSKLTKKEKYGNEYYTNRLKAQQTMEEKSIEEKDKSKKQYEQTNLEKYGVKNYSQSDEGREKIRDRQLGHRRTIGKLNGRAKEIVIVSPKGEKYICFGNFEEKCKELGIKAVTLRKQFVTSKAITRGTTVGWRIE